MTNSFKTLVWVIFEFVLIFILLSMPGSEIQGTSWISIILHLPFAEKIPWSGPPLRQQPLRLGTGRPDRASGGRTPA